MPKVYPIRAFKDNYIWLVCSRALEDATQGQPRPAVVVDPGAAAPVLAMLQQRHVQLSAILITHHHWDHVGGVAELYARYPVPVYGPPGSDIPCLSHPVHAGQSLTPAAGLPDFEVMAVPGHTRDHIAYYSPGLLFCGDTLFAGGCGRVFDGTVEQLYASLMKVSALPADTLVYCAHEYTLANLKFALHVEPGNKALQERLETATLLRSHDEPTVPSRLDLEWATNPFLRCHEPGLRASVEHHAGHALASPLEVFAALRAWKNTF